MRLAGSAEGHNLEDPVPERVGPPIGCRGRGPSRGHMRYPHEEHQAEAQHGGHPQEGRPYASPVSNCATQQLPRRYA